MSTINAKYKMSPHIPTPLPPDQDRGPQMMGAFWTMVAISTFMVGLRLYARFRIKSIGWDDYMMLITQVGGIASRRPRKACVWKTKANSMLQVFFVLGNSLITYMVHNGGGRHVWYLSEDQILLAEKWSYISLVPILIVYATAKTSVALLTLRFMGGVSVWRKSLLFFIIGSVIVVNLLTIILIFVQCRPSHALWMKVDSASCWPPSIVGNFNYFSRAWNVFVDIILALVPLSFVYKLKMKQRRKIALAVLLSLGLV